MKRCSNLVRNHIEQELKPQREFGRLYAHKLAVVEAPIYTAENNLSRWTANHIANFSIDQLSEKAIHRSKRTVLDCLGVGLIGADREISKTLRSFADSTDQIRRDGQALIWGTKNVHTSAPMAAFLNGSSCHAMDFDDTWHPATHPSGPVLPAVLALCDFLPQGNKPTLEDVLVAYNCGIEIQGSLLRCSSQANNIPNRLHPPAIVGVMGSAAATAKLLGLGSNKCLHALAIAASFAGAPMANAGTLTKPLHAGKSARFGLEAALLAEKGIEGNENILDMDSGFGAYYQDFKPTSILEKMQTNSNVILHNQDIAIKRFPCHLGMHWAIDAAIHIRKLIFENVRSYDSNCIHHIEITAPKSKYINRPIPSTEHEARHSFQFNACSALLDGKISPQTFEDTMRERKDILHLLHKTSVVSPDDNIPCFDSMYVELTVTLQNGLKLKVRCDAPYGHWRNPMSDADVKRKFYLNSSCLPKYNQMQIVNLVSEMKATKSSTELSSLLAL